MTGEWKAALETFLASLKQTQDWQAYVRAREAAFSEEANAALIRRYEEVQTAVQMAAFAGGDPDGEDVSEFSRLNTIAFAIPAVADYLTARMKMQHLVSQTVEMLSGSLDN